MAHERPGHDSFLITGAEADQDAIYQARKRRYFWMMSIRIPALIIAAIVYAYTENGLLALGIVALSIPIPWIAVLKANDREPRRRDEVPTYHYGGHRTVGPPELSKEPAPRDRFRDDRDHPVIDSPPDDEPDSGR